ncbi:MAG: NAD(P)/FAD-dependent oxidoreductase [Patescibacteria group bacterium]|nr:NAD(P)/FAD-dependent oxidoreductase [Patescibacteria group bacterium]
MTELKNGDTLIIIGGGPAGTSCAIHAKTLAVQQNKDLSVILIEPKSFGIHYNQCVGVFSPHIKQLLKDMNLEFPDHLIQRKIHGYYLNINGEEIYLPSEKHNDIAFALRRHEFDAFMIDQAIHTGVQVIRGEAVTFDYSKNDEINKFTVYCTTGTYRCKFIIGAFGVGNGIAREFYKTFRYRPPRVLQSIITKIHPLDDLYINRVFGNNIRAFLPVYRPIEFGAMTPKGNHLTINIAGERISFKDMEHFLSLNEVKNWIPPHKELTFFKGQFPTKPADNFYGDNYLIIGDAAGLVRPFKGKGINSAILSGKVAAETVVQYGITGTVLRQHFVRHPEIQKILKDYKIGITFRKLTIMASNYNLLKNVIPFAKRYELFETAMYNAVSANRFYKDILISLIKNKLK